MAKKHTQRKPQGHYCKVCGEHKANEKFSGKGHAAHICKKCAALPLDVRNEGITLRRIEGMAFRRLPEPELKWLRDRLNDKRVAVREAALDVHNIKFPRYERKQQKSGLTAHSLEFFINGVVDDETETAVNARFFADTTGVMRYIDSDSQNIELNIGQKQMKAFLKSVVQDMDAPFWAEDFSDDDGLFNDYDDDRDYENEEPQPQGEPLWSLSLELNDGSNKQIVFYNQVPYKTKELYQALMEFFEPDNDLF